MPTLNIPLAIIEHLVIRARAVQGKTLEVDSHDGSNPADDNMIAALEDDPDDLTAAELAAEIDRLEPDQRHELIALLWLGRGDAFAEEWQATVKQAEEREAGIKDSAYLLNEPLLAEYWLEGLNQLGIDAALGSRN